MLKRILALLLALFMLLSITFTLAACSDDDWDEDYSDEDDDDDDDGDDDEDDKDKDDDDEDKDGEDEDKDNDDPTTPDIPNVPSDSLSFDVDQDVTIVFYHAMGSRLQYILDIYIAEFNKIYPNIHIEHQYGGGYSDVYDQTKIDITSGNQANIVYCYPEHVALYNMANAVVSLDELMSSQTVIPGTDGQIIGLTDFERNDLIETFMDTPSTFADGNTYTMPLSKSTDVLYYNKSFFEAYDLQVPTTWEEMFALCHKIKDIDPGCIPLGIDSEANLFINMTEQLGSGYLSAIGNPYRFNTPENRSLMEMLNGYFQAGLFTTQGIYGSYTSYLFTATEGQCCYMSLGSSGGASYQMSNSDTYDGSFAFEVGVAPMPQWNPGNSKSLSQGPSICVLQGGNITDEEIMASWLFVKFLATNTEFQAEFSMGSGYMPVLKSAIEHPVYARWLNSANGFEGLTALAAQVCMDNLDSYFVTPAVPNASDARYQVEWLFVDCLCFSGSNVSGQIRDAFEEVINNLS